MSRKLDFMLDFTVQTRYGCNMKELKCRSVFDLLGELLLFTSAVDIQDDVIERDESCVLCLTVSCSCRI